MVWFLVAQIFSTLISLIQVGRLSDTEKDLEIMVLRYQLGIAERKMQKPVRTNPVERMTLAVLAGRLKKQTGKPIQKHDPISPARDCLSLASRYGPQKMDPSE
jgi:hypothetical protein